MLPEGFLSDSFFEEAGLCNLCPGFLTSINPNQPRMKSADILTADQLKEQLHTKVMEIESALTDLPQEISNQGSLMGGLAGISLFYLYLARYTENEEHLERGATLIEQAFGLLYRSEKPFPTFAGGAAGIGWTLEHAVQHEFLDLDTNEVLGQLDHYLGSYMIAEMSRGNYDYLHGALGMALYLVNRSDTSTGAPYLEELTETLLEQAVEDFDSGGLCWNTWQHGSLDVGNYNLGLSHGIPSIMALMVRLLAKDIATDNARKVLEGATRYVWASRVDAGKVGNYFPYRAALSDYQTSRLAWCYGDLGVTATLLQAARALGDEQMSQEALKVLQFNTARRDLKENQVWDAGLCHGAAGNAFLFEYFADSTGMGDARLAADYWYTIAAQMATHDEGLAGYQSFHTNKDPHWQNNYAFLEGIAGIGLCMLARLDEEAPTWADALLL